MSSIMAVARASRVALLAEGVDRNLLEQGLRHKARVALLAEGVDRNPYHCETLLGERSPSSRRAWIEIMRAVSASSWKMVALLAEGVDRNILKPIAAGDCFSPPRGGRG